MDCYTLDQTNEGYSIKGTIFYINRVNGQYKRNSYHWKIFTDKGIYSSEKYESVYKAIESIK